MGERVPSEATGVNPVRSRDARGRSGHSQQEHSQQEHGALACSQAVHDKSERRQPKSATVHQHGERPQCGLNVGAYHYAAE